MSKAKYTPGPWHFDSNPLKNEALELVRYRVVTEGKTITQCYYSSSDSCAEHDARLISAAPDLLEALMELLRLEELPLELALNDQYSADEFCTLIQKAQIDIHRSRTKAKAVIAKALGEQV